MGGYEAEIVVNDILGRPRARDYRVVPRVTFCDPEVASVGLTEREAANEGHEVQAPSSQSTDNERAHIEGSAYGLVKLVADARTGEMLGGHIVGDEAGRHDPRDGRHDGRASHGARRRAPRSTPTRRSPSR